MIFNSKKKITNKFTFNEKEIEIVKQYKYVGTIFSSVSKDPFKLNTTQLIDKACKAIFGLNVHIKDSIGYLPPDLAIKMFDKQIRPILDYASEIWYTGRQNYEIEKVHLGYLKFMLNVKTSTCTPAVYAESGRFPLEIKQKVQVIKYWKRLLDSKENTAIKNAYNSLYDSYELGQVNWCNSVKNILDESGLNSSWENQTISENEVRLVSCTLHENFVKNTLGNILDSEKYPKLRTYKLFKHDFRLANHLLFLNNRNHQIALTKFRLSSHNLRIETGRYEANSKLKSCDRLCLFCDDQTAENEHHFLLKCSNYSTFRNSLFDVCQIEITNFNNMDPLEKFMCMMKSKNSKVIAALAKFIYLSMNKRCKMDPNKSVTQKRAGYKI